MALPILNNPVYTLELPSTGEDIDFRPFLVKEQKALMIAEQSNNEKTMNKTIVELINNCTFGKLDAQKLPIFDVEMIFLKLRSKSVGETAEVIVTCPDDGKTKVPVTVNLEEIDVAVTEEHTNEINITDDIKIVMRYPTLDDVKVKKTDDAALMFDMIHKSIEEVHNGDEIITRVDMTDKELTDFIESMNTKQLESVMNFFNTMPKLRHVLEVQNPKTKKKNQIMLEGLNNFLQ